MARRVEIIVDAETGRARRELNRFTRESEQGFLGMGRAADFAIGGLVANALTSLAGHARQAVSEIFRMGTGVEETASKFATTFGPAARDVDAFLESFANMAGLTQTEGREITATLGAMAQGFGLSAEESGEFAEQIVRTAADLSSFNNASIEETLQAIQSGLIGEQEPLRRFGILLSAATVEQQALANTGKEAADELTEQEKVLARLTLIMEGAGVANGDLERTQDSTANSARRLSAELREQAQVFSQRMLPTFGVVIDTINSIRGSSEDALDSMARFVAEGLFEIVAIGSQVAQNLAQTGRLVVSVAQVMVPASEATIGWINPLQMLQEEIEGLNEFLARSVSAGNEFLSLYFEAAAAAQAAVGMSKLAAQNKLTAQSYHERAIAAAEAYFAEQEVEERTRAAIERRRQELQQMMDDLQAIDFAGLAEQFRQLGGGDEETIKLKEDEIDLTRDQIFLDRELARQRAEAERNFNLAQQHRFEMRQRDAEASEDAIDQAFAEATAFAEAEALKLEASQQRAEAEEQAQERRIKYMTRSILGARNTAEAAKNAARQVINSLLAEAIARAVASIPFPANLVLGAGAALATKALFDKLVPGFAQGVTNFRGGPAIVGERGPEMVTMPQGSNVITNENVERILQQAQQPRPAAPSTQRIVLDVGYLYDQLQRHEKSLERAGN